jgi:hypothetical protein
MLKRVEMVKERAVGLVKVKDLEEKDMIKAIIKTIMAKVMDVTVETVAMIMILVMMILMIMAAMNLGEKVKSRETLINIELQRLPD